VGAPIVWQIGPWVPGRRTTLEVLPAVWFFSDNNDYVGQNLSTDPMFQLEAHLTRDLTEHFWASLDTTWMVGGKSTVGGVAGDSLNNLGVGFTLGYQINDNISLTAATWRPSTTATRRSPDGRLSYLVHLRLAQDRGGAEAPEKRGMNIAPARRPARTTKSR